MHRLTLRFVVALITFVFGVVASTVWVVYRFSPIERSGAPHDQRASTISSNTSAEVPTVAFCDLLANPAEYNQKIVRTQAVFIANDYVRSLSDTSSCLTPHPMVGVALDPSFRYEPSDEAQRDVYDLLRAEGEKEGRSRVVIVGRFEGPILPEGSVSSRNNRMSKYQYQHRFIIMRLEKVETVTPDTN